MDIKMCECKSSRIHAHGYDEESKTMALQFKNGDKPGGTYHYTGVPKSLYDELVKAESIGKFFHKRVSGNKDFPWKKV